MANNRKQMNWLLEQLPLFRDRDLIDPVSEEKLRNYCLAELSAGENRNYYPLALSIAGTILIAGGIILLLNYNWDMFPKAVRITIAFLPLLLGAAVSFFALLGGRGQFWREAGAILTAAGGATATAVLSHIYHVGGTLSEFMTLVLLTTFPLIYIFSSHGLILLYVIGLFMTLDFRGGTGPVLPLVLTALPLPYLLYLMRRESGDAVYARYLTLVAALFVCIRFSELYCLALMLLTLGVLLMLAASKLRKDGVDMIRNPWLLCSFLLLTVLLSIGTFDVNLFRVSGWRKENEIIQFWIVEGVLLAGCAALFIRDFLKKNMDFQKILLMLLLLAGLQGLAFHLSNAGYLCIRIELICLMGVFGITLLMRGVREGSLLLFNGGLLMTGTLIICRFFDSGIGLLERSIGFIVLGIGFIAANIIFSRRLSARKEVSNETK